MNAIADTANTNVQSNVKNRWLPTTLKLIKGSNEVIMASLGPDAWSAKLLIVKSNRLLGITSDLSDSELDLIETALVHTRVEIRGAAFSGLFFCPV